MRNKVQSTLVDALRRAGWWFRPYQADLLKQHQFCIVDQVSGKLHPYDSVVVVSAEAGELTVYAAPYQGYHEPALPPQSIQPTVVKLKPGTVGRALTIAVLKELRALEGVHMVSGLNTVA